MSQFKISTVVVLACFAFGLHSWRVPPTPSIGQASQTASARANTPSMQFMLNGQASQTASARANTPSMQFMLNGVELPRPIEPLDNKLLVKIRSDAGETKSSGLILARNESTDNRPKSGVVVAVGPGGLDHKSGNLVPPPFNVGDMVWVEKRFGDSVYWQGSRHVILEADEVLGSFEGGEVSSAAFRPNGDLVMVEMPVQKEKTTDFGIVIAGTDEEDNNQGVVRAVGPGRRVSVGESVLFKPYAGIEVELEDRSFKLVDESEILIKWNADEQDGGTNEAQKESNI